MAAEAPSIECWELRCGSKAYVQLAQIPAHLTLADIETSALATKHFSVRPDEVEGWAGLTKKALKREMNELRYKKLAEERKARAAVAASAAVPPAPPSEPRKRARDPEDSPSGEPGVCQRKARDLRAERAAWAERALAAGVRICVDCSFATEAYMGLRDQISLTSQLAQAYGAARKHSAHPARIVLTGVPDSMLARFGRLSGVMEWGVGIYSQDYTEVFSLSQLAPAALCEAGESADAPGASAASAASASAAPAPLARPGPLELTALDARQGPAWAAAVARGVEELQPRPWKRPAPPSTPAGGGAGDAGGAGSPDPLPRDPPHPAHSTAAAAASTAVAADPAWPPCPPSLRPLLCYLTADSPHVLEALEPGVVYVVGGLIDRNRFKGVTHRCALWRGVGMPPASRSAPLDRRRRAERRRRRAFALLRSPSSATCPTSARCTCSPPCMVS